jgi:tRNA modification GTPase
MYELNDTIVAVSSPTSGQRVIVRVTGPDAIDKCEQIFSAPIPKDKSGLINGSVAVDDELRIDAKLYLFLAPHSYTGDDVVEIHSYTNPSVTEVLLGRLLGKGLRMAEPGEFTARAYLNGKIDLAQAEAVNEIITSSNEFQLAAAERLFAGRLAETTAKIRSDVMDCLGLIEAGLDFSQEDIEFITHEQAVEKLEGIKSQLEQLLSGSISCEAVIDLPAVGIAGAPNAGKSSLLNKLLGRARSIVSDQRKTTRDVLTGLLRLEHCGCVLFDCAGLIRCSMLDARCSILDELAQQAAIEALRNSSVVVFCVDISKVDWSEDVAIRELIKPEVLIAVATKSDLLCEDVLAERLGGLDKLFAADFLATSAKDGTGVEQLKNVLDEKVIELALGSGKRGTKDEGQGTSLIALTVRHRQAVTEAIENVDEAINELKVLNDEVAAMMLRAAFQALSGIGRQNIDEQVLENIFRRFCIGK